MAIDFHRHLTIMVISEWETTETRKGDETMTTIKEALKYQDHSIHGGEIDVTADEWLDAGFLTGEACEPWWHAGCFDAAAAATLRDNGILPEECLGLQDEQHGFSLAYAYANSDISLDEVKRIVAENKSE